MPLERVGLEHDAQPPVHEVGRTSSASRPGSGPAAPRRGPARPARSPAGPTRTGSPRGGPRRRHPPQACRPGPRARSGRSEPPAGEPVPQRRVGYRQRLVERQPATAHLEGGRSVGGESLDLVVAQVDPLQVHQRPGPRRSVGPSGTATCGRSGTALTFQPWARAAEARDTCPHPERELGALVHACDGVPAASDPDDVPGSSASSSARRDVAGRSAAAWPPRRGPA